MVGVEPIATRRAQFLPARNSGDLCSCTHLASRWTRWDNGSSHIDQTRCPDGLRRCRAGV